MTLPSGLYDLLLTEGFERLLASDPPARHEVQPPAEEAAEFLVDALVRPLGVLLEELPGEGAEAAQQLTLVNDLRVCLRQRLHLDIDENETARIDLLAGNALLLPVRRAVTQHLTQQPGSILEIVLIDDTSDLGRDGIAVSNRRGDHQSDHTVVALALRQCDEAARRLVGLAGLRLTRPPMVADNGPA